MTFQMARLFIMRNSTKARNMKVRSMQAMTTMVRSTKAKNMKKIWVIYPILTLGLLHKD